MEETQSKRITMKLVKPNPLFEKWLSEWNSNEENHNSKSQYIFGRALKSLKKYPLPLKTGTDCIILDGFGPKICEMLNKKLKQFNSKVDLDATIDYRPDLDVLLQNTSKTSKPNAKRKINEHMKEYVPSYRSGAYGILLTLYKDSLSASSNGYMLKEEIIKEGCDLCDKSFTKPDPGSSYTSWSSMSTLLEKSLVNKVSNPAKYTLSDQGLIVAHKLYKNHLEVNNKDMHKDETFLVKDYRNINEGGLSSKINKNLKDPSINENKLKVTETHERNKVKVTKSTISTTSISTDIVDQFEDFILHSKDFDILLLVDVQETSGSKNRKSYEDEIIMRLNNLHVLYEVRHLKVGDYTWICREKDEPKRELILPYIVERKRMDDFGHSIKDGRFHEQKFRLKQSGIQNLIYLVESYGHNDHCGLPLATLQQAATNTLVHDGFSVIFTGSLKETAQYLASFSGIMINLFKNKTLACCKKQDLTDISIEEDLITLMSFSEFNRSASKAKNFKVQELFIKQLLQLKGLSVDKAMAIVNKYPTPKCLKLKYNELSQTEGEQLLSNIRFGKMNKNLGHVISKTIYQLYTLQKY